jgi:hypothetical protein
MTRTFILFILSFKLFAQNGAPIFEFNHDFKKQVCSFKNLTDELFREERKHLKIKSIRVSIPGNSLDSLYFSNKEYFQNEINNYSRRHSPYSLIKIYNYDKYGFLLEHFQYPICQYLTKTDSLKLNKAYYKYLNSNDTTTIYQYFNDSLNEKTIHVKDEIIYKTSKQPELIKVYDSHTKQFTFDTKRYRFIETSYQYYLDGRLKSISNRNKPDSDYQWHFEYPNKNKTLITSVQYDLTYDSTYTYQNLITKDKDGRILESLLFEKRKPIHSSTYTMHYDKMGYLKSIDRRETYEKAFDEKYTYYTFKNYYDKSKLVKTIAHYNFNVVENDIIYNFDNNGLIKSVDYKDYKEVFEYEFYKN